MDRRRPNLALGLAIDGYLTAENCWAEGGWRAVLRDIAAES